ncbi:MAG: AAA family ATPase [Bacteroidales bacterium]|nr:AAA family ATPase [Bacteroidales bacterium]
MKRKIYDKLLKWKKNNKGKVALLIEGARRIGKSYIAEEFAKNEYETYLLIDFSKANQQIKELFDQYVEHLDDLFLRLSAYYSKPLLPRLSPDDEARTLIIFDEVQFCPKARAAIKHLVLDHRFDYIETGSLVSIKKNVEGILIPSEERRLDMYPMDFEEFLWANGADTLMPMITSCFQKKTPMEALHRKALDFIRKYLIVGGMPRPVLEFINSNDFESSDEAKRDILNLYRNDIHKYAGPMAPRVLSIFDELPGQLQRHDRVFRLSALEDDARMREYQDAFLWLSEARIVNCAYNSTAPNIGLRLNEDRTTVKCYMGDTGLLLSHAFDEKGIVSNELYKKILFDKLEVNLGMLVENLVAQMLKCSGYNLFFYNKWSEEKDDRMEIDFLIPKPTITSRHNISPIEVKSSTRYTLASLRKCMAKFERYLSTPYVLHEQDLREEDGILYLPLYMTPLL